jgi:hypothetical protein
MISRDARALVSRNGGRVHSRARARPLNVARLVHLREERNGASARVADAPRSR